MLLFLLALQDLAPEPLFETRILPVLEERCFECHTRAGGMDSDLLVDSLAGLLDGGMRGPAIVPGDPGRSLLYQAIAGTHASLDMPPDAALPAETVQDFHRWIEIGAPWSADAGAARETWWSRLPMADPAPPAVDAPELCDNEIDRFLQARIEAAGLTPARIADRSTLLRRVTYDLTGLPPTPAELEAFLADEGPDAWSRVVDRLLASPAYGEAWGRRWLDVARYADTAGDSSDYPVEDAWRYRNWVIESFNADLPYDEFLTLQLAGDLVDGPEETAADRVVATGFLALARRYGVGRDQDRHMIIADQIDTLGRAVLGETLACARCHDHKTEPIATEEYYALYGIFDSTTVPFPGSENEKAPERLVPIVVDGQPANAYAAQEGKPRNAHVQRGGHPKKKGDKVPRGFPAALTIDAMAPAPAIREGSGSGRRELAAWITDPEHPRTARVLVNRVWEGHFGVGLVATPSDFGGYGAPPSHPELLDWLARRFVEDGWSIKALHRRILLSQAYRRGSIPSDMGLAIDPENALLARFSRRRLRAEELRDTLLLVAGDLVREPPTAHPFPKREDWKWTQHRPFGAVYSHDHRSVYLMTQRLRRHPFLALFDGADTNQSTARRQASTVPQQTLWLRNEPWLHARAAAAGARWHASGDDDAARMDVALLSTYARTPREDERAELTAWVRAEAEDAAARGADDPDAEAWAGLARVLFASNEALYID